MSNSEDATARSQSDLNTLGYHPILALDVYLRYLVFATATLAATALYTRTDHWFAGALHYMSFMLFILSSDAAVREFVNSLTGLLPSDWKAFQNGVEFALRTILMILSVAGMVSLTIAVNRLVSP